MNFIDRIIRKKVLGLLTKTSSESFVKIGEDKLIEAFQNAAKNVPAYKALLKEKGVDPSMVTDIESFKRLVPIIDKKVFSKYDIGDLCKDGDLSKMAGASTSSGFSGEFSYVLTSEKGFKNFKFMADILLDYVFKTSQKKTFFINTLGSGVRMYTDLPLAETSVKPDMVIALIKKFSPHFQQFIIMGNTYFIKKVLEDGIAQGIDWKKIRVHILIGEDWFPESYRSYLAHLLGIDLKNPEDGLIISTMGISELGTTLFQETHNKTCIRQATEENEDLRHELFGKEAKVSPLFFHYHPYQMYLESIDGELVFTTLSSDTMIPLIRYNSHDSGNIYSYDKVKEILGRFGHRIKEPEPELPIVAVMGRRGKAITVNDRRHPAGFETRAVTVTPEEVKAGLYSDIEAASKTTGYFTMSKDGESLRIELQLKDGINPSDELKDRFYNAISRHVDVGFELLLYAYQEFPYGMELNYENKFNYIARTESVQKSLHSMPPTVTREPAPTPANEPYHTHAISMPEESSPQKERRASERFKSELPAAYTLPGEHGEKDTCKAMDISELGIGISVDKELAEGAPMTLVLDIPGTKEEIKAKGEVVWSKEILKDRGVFHSGVKFTSLKESDRARLIRYIRSLSKPETP